MYEKVIAIALYRRPEATRKLFEALLKCDGIEEYTLVISLDFDSSNPDCHAVNEVVHEYCISPHDYSLLKSKSQESQEWKRKLSCHSYHAHEPRLGIDGNKIWVISKAFEVSTSGYIVFFEDDTPMSEDALRYFEWAGSKFRDNPAIFSVSGHSFFLGKTPEEIDPGSAELFPGFSVWGFGAWKEKYEKIYGLSGEKYREWCSANNHPYNGVYDHFGTLSGLLRVRPLLSRTRHSEWENAEHTPSKEWWEVHEDNSQCWAGNLDLKQFTEHWEWSLNCNTIVIDCDSSPMTASLNGGSEEQAVMLAEGLAALNQEVILLCGGLDYEKEKRLVNNVLYTSQRESDTPCDIYCSQRNYHKLKERKAPLQVLLCHDIPVPPHFPSREEISQGALENIDMIMVLNQYHKEIYEAAGCPSEKLFIIPIGIRVEQFDIPVQRISGRCIFCSHPNRGIQKLASFWPKIKELSPHATLQPCWWDFNDAPFFLEENKELGILPTKICSHEELAVELLSSEVLAYPCTFSPEISPASTIKAQIAGAVPVTINQGGMRDTVQFGHPTDDYSFAHAVSSALEDREWREKTRDQGMAWSRGYYDHRNLAAHWLAAITKGQKHQ